MTRPIEGETWNALRNLATLKDFVLYLSHLRNTRQYLLLGDDDNTRMRLLFVPEDGSTPEIMPLPLTFAEALERLGAVWERLEEVRRDREATTVGKLSQLQKSDVSHSEPGNESKY